MTDKFHGPFPGEVPTDAGMPYPRLCAHRGFNSVAPENSLPAYGAAVALGASEIECDLWPTADGEIVSCHDPRIDRTSNGTGFVYEHTLAELKTYDFGVKKNEAFRGLRILEFEDILRQFARRVIINIHLKGCREDGLDETYLKKIIDLIDRYDCRQHVYFMAAEEVLQMQLKRLAPDIARCGGGGPTDETKWGIVERAIRCDCQKVQLFKPCFDQALIDKAKAAGIHCNVFYADDPEEAKQYLAMGIETILTNDYQRISFATGVR